jgi:NAD+ kinase
VKRAGILLHAVRPEAAAVGRKLAGWLAARGIEVTALGPDAARLGPPVEASEAFPEGADVLFVLGGDGTMLRAAELACEAGVPLLGVNFGRLGFLASLERSELEPSLDAIVNDKLIVDERMVIVGELETQEEHSSLWALNDAIVQKASVGRAVVLSVAIGGVPLVTITADGVIVATPTGSTAYSFSAGGPIVSPELDCLIVTPVAAHSLVQRSFVAGPGETVEIEVVSEGVGALLSVDGRTPHELYRGSKLRLRASERRVKLARVEAHPFWTLVREKFGLA